MKRKTLLALSVIPLTFLLSSCFALQGFWIVANQIEAGGKPTKAVFKLRPATSTSDNAHQFFLVGVADDNDLVAGKATWGTNGTFGGPYPLPVSAGLATVIGSDCAQNGFNLADVTGVTWKGYVTPTTINDKNKVNKSVLVQVGLKAVDAATVTDQPVIGVTGAWADDGDNVPEGTDTYLCTGVSQVSVNVRA